MAYRVSALLSDYHPGNVSWLLARKLSSLSRRYRSLYVIYRSAPASPSHVGLSGLMTPECLSREASPGPESYPDSSVPSPAGQLTTSQSAPGSPGHPYTSTSQSIHKGRLMQQQVTVVTNGVSGDAAREGKRRSEDLFTITIFIYPILLFYYFIILFPL